MAAKLEPETAPALNRHTAVGRAPRQPAEARPPTETPRALGPFFWLATHAPSLARACAPIAVRLVPLVSRRVRLQTRRNSALIFGRTLSVGEQRAYTRGVLRSFIDFVIDVGQSSHDTAARLLERIECTEGEAGYRAARATRRGAIMVTAHMGSFEVGLAALRQVEPRVHVVYRRDASGPFESMRARMRRRLGVIEAPIDDGLGTWMSLRDGLFNDDVVVVQADRAMPGQRSQRVPFLHGHIRIPTGAVRLARMTGCPIIPVYTVRLSSGRFAVYMHAAIEPQVCAGATIDPAVLAVAESLESMVAKHPQQWLVLGAAFEEDVEHA
ncbi:MAG: lysophospholipid acyltransferase family protein [Phycisphaerales bacterium]|nr:lysophospholipid acyltransferase family protein [Phycisphaerales bacterium]